MPAPRLLEVSRRIRIATSPPPGLYLIAFVTRLAKIRVNRCGHSPGEFDEIGGFTTQLQRPTDRPAVEPRRANRQSRRSSRSRHPPHYAIGKTRPDGASGVSGHSPIPRLDYAAAECVSARSA